METVLANSPQTRLDINQTQQIARNCGLSLQTACKREVWGTASGDHTIGGGGGGGLRDRGPGSYIYIYVHMILFNIIIVYIYIYMYIFI